MRICFVGDPRSIHTQRWIRWFADRHDVALVATVRDRALEDLTAAVLPASGSIRGLRLLDSVRVMRAAVRRITPDLVHGHYINEAGWFAAACGMRPVVITAWGSDLYRAPHESPLAARLNPRALRAADHVTCDSHDQVRVIRGWGVAAERISVIGWGVDRRAFHPAVDGSALRRRLAIPAGSRVVLSPRQWLENSNIDAIVEAHARLGEDAYLVLKRLPRFETGHGTQIHAAIAASPARERIRVVGEIVPDELPALYAAADVVVSLCRTDGTPVSILEAMAIGRPIVALRNESVAEWVAPPGGHLVDDLAPATVADGLSSFLDDPRTRERAAEHNLALIAERADRAREMGRMEEVYARLVEGTDGP